MAKNQEERTGKGCMHDKKLPWSGPAEHETLILVAMVTQVGSAVQGRRQVISLQVHHRWPHSCCKAQSNRPNKVQFDNIYCKKQHFNSAVARAGSTDRRSPGRRIESRLVHGSIRGNWKHPGKLEASRGNGSIKGNLFALQLLPSSF